jgi:hypothetical protein
VVNTFDVRVRVCFHHCHELTLHALAAVEQAWAQVQRANLN